MNTDIAIAIIGAGLGIMLGVIATLAVFALSNAIVLAVKTKPNGKSKEERDADVDAVYESRAMKVTIRLTTVGLVVASAVCAFFSFHHQMFFPASLAALLVSVFLVARVRLE